MSGLFMKQMVFHISKRRQQQFIAIRIAMWCNHFGFFFIPKELIREHFLERHVNTLNNQNCIHSDAVYNLIQHQTILRNSCIRMICETEFASAKPVYHRKSTTVCQNMFFPCSANRKCYWSISYYTVYINAWLKFKTFDFCSKRISALQSTLISLSLTTVGSTWFNLAIRILELIILKLNQI